jgi:hypothetical protein
MYGHSFCQRELLYTCVNERNEPALASDNLHVVRCPGIESVRGQSTPEVRPRLVWTDQQRCNDVPAFRVK